MGSILGHPWVKRLLKRGQKLITFINASHRPHALLKQTAAALGIKRLLVTSNKTRFTSVHASIESIVRLQPAREKIVRQNPGMMSAEVEGIITDDMMFLHMKQICKLLEPSTLVIMAVQSDECTLADIQRYWMHLAKCMAALNSVSSDSDFNAHCIAAFNMRQLEMQTPLCRLALFLHPWYRSVAAKSEAEYREVLDAAAIIWKNNRHGAAAIKALLSEIGKYRLGRRPFFGALATGDLSSLRDYWENIRISQPSTTTEGEQYQLPSLARIVHDIKPHAADPEKTFSLMSFYHTARRNQLLSKITSAMTAIKMHRSANDKKRSDLLQSWWQEIPVM